MMRRIVVFARLVDARARDDDDARTGRRRRHARAADDAGHGCDDAGHATTRCLPSARARAVCAPVSEETTDGFA